MDKEKLIEHLKAAIAAFEKGKALFEGDFSEFPEGKEDEIMAHCKECSKNMDAAMELDTVYSKVYKHFSDGGTESDCRIAKNRWCFAKQDFVKARLEDLGFE
ncbi:MAG: hypothetical protein ABIE94_02905 [archaeon]